MTKNKEPRTVFGQRLRYVRQARGMPQDRLGVAIGIDETAAGTRVSRYETGTHEPPYETALLIAKALGVEVAYFYADDECLAELILNWRSLSPLVQLQLLAKARKNVPKSSN